MRVSPAIEVRDLHVAYDGTEVLKGVDLTVADGDFVGIVGPNGSGKTTLLRAIVGLLRPLAGEVRIRGVSSHRLRDRAAVAYVPQHAVQVDPTFPASAMEVVLLGRVTRRGLLRRWTRADRDAARKALELVGAEALAGRLIGTLSGGERQRVFLAKALAAEPDILILDEPTTGVDPRAREGFYQLLDHLNHTTNLTVLLVSHDLEALRLCCHRIVGINQRVVFDGSPAELGTTGGLAGVYDLHVSHEHGGHDPSHHHPGGRS